MLINTVLTSDASCGHRQLNRLYVTTTVIKYANMTQSHVHHEPLWPSTE